MHLFYCSIIMSGKTERDDVLSLMIHLGHLGYDDERSEVFIPNCEILDEFKSSTKDKEMCTGIRFIQDFIGATIWYNRTLSGM